MRRRTKAAVIRMPKVAKHTENYYYTCLTLFFPHRCESEFLSDFTCARDSFIERMQTHSLKMNQLTAYDISNELEEALRYFGL